MPRQRPPSAGTCTMRSSKPLYVNVMLAQRIADLTWRQFGHGAHSVALRVMILPITFRAFVRIDDEGVAFHGNGGVRAFEFASAASGALRHNDLVSYLPLQGCFERRERSYRAIRKNRRLRPNLRADIMSQSGHGSGIYVGFAEFGVRYKRRASSQHLSSQDHTAPAHSSRLLVLSEHCLWCGSRRWLKATHGPDGDRVRGGVVQRGLARLLHNTVCLAEPESNWWISRLILNLNLGNA